MAFLFTSEAVSEGHPDKISDQISDAILDEFLRRDREAKVACETLCTTGLVVVAGEVRSDAYVDVQEVARRVINRIGYTKSEYMFDGNSCGVLSAIHEQSPDINQGVVQEEESAQGAGDQGIMFGYACDETREFMPATLILAQVIMKELAVIRREHNEMPYLRPDAKSQVTIEYDESGCPVRVHTIVVSTQHDEFVRAGGNVSEKEAERQMCKRIEDDVRSILIPRVKARLQRANDKLADLIGDDYLLYVNPTGKFVIGGPHGDTGVTGRKVIVDTYGGRGAHGGGAFSGKDSSKVDRSAAYAARHIAKNMVAAGIADQVLVQLSYAIGIAYPLSIFVDTYGTAHVRESDSEIARRIEGLFDLSPAAIVERFGLKNPIFEATASYGHFGNRPYKKEVTVYENGCPTTREVEFFSWEKLDEVDRLRREFNL
ncbi:MAG TPA: methionine adenosyltransferase [Candidatus Tidjanibacter faecipullorum]|uniref:S-adenosylmethionine synthase n=1 Tax=Candidatus Tidjanibacter faecipullorum TaxID=2838766 RepID=A0A9D2DE68_9BACT|nr:methionine adenosyltransferase [Candidatus Tidjanibacter faecipullorum]